MGLRKDNKNKQNDNDTKDSKQDSQKPIIKPKIYGKARQLNIFAKYGCL